MNGKLIYYWDSAPIIAWLQNEKRADPAEMEGLAEVLSLVHTDKAILITSVLWRSEVLSYFSIPEHKNKLQTLFQSRRMQEVSADIRVMALAGEIRNHYKRASGEKKVGKDIIKNIRVPDAIHLASAITYKAIEFHTFDGKKTNGTHAALFTLSGNVVGHNLKICTPRGIQGQLIH